MLKINRVKIPRITLLVAAACLIVIGLSLGWYLHATQPPSQADQAIQVDIETGMSPEDIATELKSVGAIRSPIAFKIYLKLHGLNTNLRAGHYELKSNMPLSEVVAAITEGPKGMMTITFYPGATLYDPRDIESSKRTDAYTILKRAGYSEKQINKSFKDSYSSPLFAGKPKSANLEGYIYGETYSFEQGASLEDVLSYVFETFYQEIENYQIVEGAKKHNLSLFELLSLASIIEKEVHCPNSTDPCSDRQKVAQVFYKRLDLGMPLGADATFVYAADQQNKSRAINFDSPYNTRIHAGLPPGPIATPSIGALRAAIEPAKTNYLYFVSGDNGKNYFSKTQAEHEASTARYCKKLCYQF